MKEVSLRLVQGTEDFDEDRIGARVYFVVPVALEMGEWYFCC